MLALCARWFYGASLITLPMVGVGVLKLATGRDWGGGLQPSWLFLALAMAAAFLDKWHKGNLVRDFRQALPRRLRSWWLGGLAGICLALLLSFAGLWWAPAAETFDAARDRFLKQVIQLGIMLCFLFWPALWTRGRARWTWTVKLLLVGGMLQFGYGALQGADYYFEVPGFAALEKVCTSNPSIFSGSGELYLGDAFRHIPRLRGTACEPLYLGNYLLLLLPLTLVSGWSQRIRCLVGAALLVLLLGTWSRGAWLGLIAQILLGAGIYFLRRRQSPGIDGASWWKPALWILGTLLLAAPLIGLAAGWDGLLYPYRRLAQTFSGQDWSNLTRLYSMQAAWRAFLLSPLVGVGWGQFAWHFPILVDPMGLQSQFTWPVVNNFPLQVLCETGLVGILVFLGWVGGLARAFVNRLKEDVIPAEENGRGMDRKLLMVVLLGVCGVWIQLLTFSQYNLPHIWLAAGLALAAVADSGSEDRGPVGEGESES